MTELRVNASSDYSAIANYLFRDSRLSLAAKGLLASLLILGADGSELTIDELAELGTDGKAAVRTALQRLERVGYIRRSRSHDAAGKFAGNIWDVFERPDTAAESEASSSCDFPTMENRTMAAEPSCENRTMVSSKNNNNEVSTKLPMESSKDEDIKKDLTPPKSPPEHEGSSEPPAEPKSPRKKKSPKSVPDWNPVRFEGFWNFYPRGDCRASAVDAWDKLKPDDDLIDRIAAYLKIKTKTKMWKQGIGIPYAVTFINQRRWEDPIPAFELAEANDDDDGDDDDDEHPEGVRPWQPR